MQGFKSNQEGKRRKIFNEFLFLNICYYIILVFSIVYMTTMFN